MGGLVNPDVGLGVGMDVDIEELPRQVTESMNGGNGGEYEVVDSDGSEESSTAAMEDGAGGIVSFLRGQKILITGATGFLAKLLVEKVSWFHTHNCEAWEPPYVVLRQ